MYALGRGLQQSWERAAPLYERACDGGVMDACKNLGGMYMIGVGVPHDEERSRALFRRACDGGEQEACAMLH
jgi:TPR repeat protein